jgi:hypothetical protein
MPVPDFSPGEVLTAAAMDSIGLWLVKTQTIGTAVSSVTVNDAFSANYDNYKIILAGGTGSVANADLRITIGGSSTGYYGGVLFHAYSTAGPANVQAVGFSNAAFLVCGLTTSDLISSQIEIFGPQKTQVTGFTMPFFQPRTAGALAYAQGYHNVASSYTSFTLSAASGTMTGGTIRVYGYRN